MTTGVHDHGEGPLVASAVTSQHLRDARQREGLVERPPDECLDPGQGPGLVRPAVRNRALGQLDLQHGEQRVAQLRRGDRPRRAQPLAASFLPGPALPLHRAFADS